MVEGLSIPAPVMGFSGTMYQKLSERLKQCQKWFVSSWLPLKSSSEGFQNKRKPGGALECVGSCSRSGRDMTRKSPSTGRKLCLIEAAILGRNSIIGSFRYPLYRGNRNPNKEGVKVKSELPDLSFKFKEMKKRNEISSRNKIECFRTVSKEEKSFELIL
jgi:hypothetical protein